MSAPVKPQSFANHARFVPGYHFFTGTLVLVILGWSLYRAATARTADAAFGVFVGIALIAEFIYIRTFPLNVQDRVIRLEERLRLARLAPERQVKWDALTASQLVALRFASDAELPALAAQIVDEKILDRKTITSMIKNWRPDYMRV